jgi:hypothetical protein
MQSSELLRADIVGKRVVNILEGPCQIDDDGYGASDVFVELDGEILFVLGWSDDINPPPIAQAAASVRSDLRLAPEHFRRAAIGKTIVEVVCSEQWPGMGLLLEGDMLVCCYTAIDPYIVGSCVDTLGAFFSREDLVTYWGQMPIS